MYLHTTIKFKFLTTLTIDLSHNDVNCGFEMLCKIRLALEKYRANYI